MLHLLVEKANSLRIFKGITLDRLTCISHLQFVDDKILFINNDKESVKGVKVILLLFKIMSGLKINYHKISLFGSDNNSNLQEYAIILNCKVGTWPMQYLGASIGKSTSNISFWEPLILKFHSKLKGWKNMPTLMAERLVILKATLDNISIYWLNLCKIPSDIIKRTDKIRRDFLWNGPLQKSRKIHLLQWDKVCSNKNNGGLGISSIKERNIAQLEN